MGEGEGVLDPGRWRPIGQLGALLATGLLIAAAVQLSGRLGGDGGASSVMWLANALQLGIVLLLARRWWPPVLAMGAAISVVLTIRGGAPVVLALCAAGADLLVVLVAARALSRDRAWIDGRVDSVATWFRFCLWAAIVAPLVGAALGTLSTIAVLDLPVTPEVARSVGTGWYLSDALAMCIVVPIVIRLRPAALVDAWFRHPWYEAVALVGAMAAVSVAVLANASVVALYLVIPVLIVAVFRYGFVGLGTEMAVVTVAVLGFTGRGEGPFAAIADGDPRDATVLAQVFLLVLFATIVLIAALAEQSRRQAVTEEVNEEVYELLAASSGATIFVADLDGWVRYVSNNVAGMLGLFGKQLLGNGWVDHVHPDDEPIARRGAVRTVDGGDAFLFRMRHVDGSWRWVEATIRRTERRDRRGQTVRVGMMRDVTARVDREIDLRSANVRLAEAAATDPLTGLANRRRFADERTSAWRRSIEDHQPISLLLVDVDNFKAFNDRYGHAQGDACLQIIAEALESSVRTPFDVCARYGGEEFVVLLPATDRRDAVIVANRCRDAVRRRRVPHEGTAPGIVTVSVGVGTMEPMPGDDFGRLFDATDAAMYRSKRHGRDCIEIDDLVPRADRRAG